MDWLDSGIVLDATTMAEDIHVLRIYTEFGYTVLLPIALATLVVVAVCFWFYRTYFWF